MRKSEKYDFGKSEANGGRRSSGVLLFVDGIVAIITIICAIALICAYIAPNISPKSMWMFAFAGLVFPILYVANCLLMLYWAIRWKLMIILPALVVLVGIGNIALFFRPSFSKDYSRKDKSSTIVMSYNVMGFLCENNKGEVVSSLDSITSFIVRHRPDILCIQEFQSKSQESKSYIDSLTGLKYSKINYKVKNSYGGGWGLAVYSRYPILRSGVIDYPNTTNSSMWVDIVAGRDTVRVFNNHLQTTSVGAPERNYITSAEIIQNTPDREERVRGIMSKLKRNYITRASQVDTLAPIIRESAYPVIVTGDFNDTPMSYTYQTICGNLKDSFAEKGSGITSNTYKGLFNLFRIDYILHSKEIEALSYSAPIYGYSDHKPVIAAFSLPGQRESEKHKP